MAVRSARPISVTLGALGATAERRVQSGAFASMSEVMRAGLRALDREDALLDDMLKARVERALADPRPSVPLDAGFAEVRARAAARRAMRGD